MSRDPCPPGCRCPRCLDFEARYLLAHARGILSRRATVEACKLTRAGVPVTAASVGHALALWLLHSRPYPIPARKEIGDAAIGRLVELCAAEAAGEHA
jgi:hypothetical protein